jgi:Cu(I)/Ag(I) efflux system membrane fusion protein
MSNEEMEAMSESAEATAAEVTEATSSLGDLVWSSGVVEHVMDSERMISITHAPVPQWEWPEMTMSFELAEDIDVADIETGEEYEFQMNRLTGNRIVITELNAFDSVQ